MAITEMIEVAVNAERLAAFAAIIEKHAGALRRDLEAFAAAGKHATQTVTVNVSDQVTPDAALAEQLRQASNWRGPGLRT